MAGIILDFDGREFNAQRDITRYIREMVEADDGPTAVAFRDAFRERSDSADMTIAMLCGWAFRQETAKAAEAMTLFGVTNTVFGATPPAAATAEVWETAPEGGGQPGTLEQQIQAGVDEADAVAEGDE